MATLTDVRNLLSDAREGKGRFFRQEDPSWMKTFLSDVRAGRRRRYDPKIGMPEVAGAAIPAALGPGLALGQYESIFLPRAKKVFESVKKMPYRKLEGLMQFGDVGLQGMYDSPYKILLEGSAAAGGQPLGHGLFVAGDPSGKMQVKTPYSGGKGTKPVWADDVYTGKYVHPKVNNRGTIPFLNVFHGGQSSVPVSGSTKHLLPADRPWVLSEASHRPWLNKVRAGKEALSEMFALEQGSGSYASGKAVPESESFAKFLRRRSLYLTSRYKSLKTQLEAVSGVRSGLAALGGAHPDTELGKQFLRQLSTHDPVPKLLMESDIKASRGNAVNAVTGKARRATDHYSSEALKRITLLMRPKVPLTEAQKIFMHRQLGMDLSASYSTPKAAKAFLSSIFLPKFDGPATSGLNAKLCRSGSAMCGSQPAKILKALGLTGRFSRVDSALPGNILENLNLKPVGIAGTNAKVRALAHLATVANRRRLLGLAAILGTAAVGGTATHAVRNILEKRD